MKLRKILWWLRLRCLAPIFGKVGKSSYLASSISIIGAKNIFIGDKVRIFPGNRMETYNNGSIHIGDNCSIGQNFHVTSTDKELIIGSNTTILGNVFVTNIDHDYRNIGVPILEQPMLFKETIIGENCFIGFGASIQAGTVLGKQCIVGTNAVVRGTYPDYSVIVGVPAKAIKRYNEETGDWEKI
ncbi:acyltransferase [Streptococcus suis]|nr:acyltransferase [Streptococcus suis]HEM6086699.1 acyltransferase [Streptococcus suis]HEM6103345.1 acyltransferase [Streptococcus suis]